MTALIAALGGCGSSSGSNNLGAQSYQELPETNDLDTGSRITTPSKTFDISISWRAPIERQNGQPLFDYELAGYEITYESLNTERKSVFISGGDNTSFVVDDLSSELYEFRIATIDVDNLSSGYSDPLLVDLRSP